MKSCNSEAICGIYAIINLRSGRTYIGSAVNVRQRWTTHRYGLRSGRHNNPDLLRDWRAQAARDFLFITLRHCSEDLLEASEQDAIDGHAGQLYNVFPARRFPGRVGLGKPKSEAHRASISSGLRGRPKSRAAIEKMRAALTGRKLPPRSAETCAKLSAANKGQTPWIKGRTQSIEHHARIHAARQRFLYARSGKAWPDLMV